MQEGLFEEGVFFFFFCFLVPGFFLASLFFSSISAQNSSLFIEDERRGFSCLLQWLQDYKPVKKGTGM